MVRILLLPLAIAAAALALSGCGDGPAASGVPDQMERIEERTEEFANQMLDLGLAVQRGNFDDFSDAVAARMTAVILPAGPGEVRLRNDLVEEFGRVLDPATSEMSDADFVRRFAAVFDHFSDLEDVRFKVKKSAVGGDGSSIDATLALMAVGRDRQGRREWLRGRAAVRAERSETGRWILHDWEFSEAGSLRAVREIFDEVALPAGVSRTDPTFLERTGPPFAAYGAATGDLDGDGLLDLVTTSEKGTAVYLNLGDGRFRDAAAETFVATVPGNLVAPLMLDADNDGDLDLFFSAIGEQKFLENRLIPDGRPEFWDVSLEAGVARPATGFSAVAADVDGNGFPDIYVASYNRYGEVLPDHWDGATNGTPNLLFLNRGDGTFDEAAQERGVADSRWGYASAFADVDGDGDLDLYTTNDFGGGNALYINRDGHFVDEARERGVYDGAYGMGASFADYDRDGDLDLHVTRMSSTAGRRILSRLGGGELPERDRLEAMAVGNALYRNDGDGRFSEVSAEVGPFGAGWAWGGGFLDIDNDGFSDLYTPNGFISGSRLHDT